MDNYSKHIGSVSKRMLVVLGLALALQLLPAGAASAAAPPAQSPGCETYACLYEVCTTHYSRGMQRSCTEQLSWASAPTEPGQWNLVRVLWPGHYDPARRAMWDQVAYCESTWRWSYNGGSGYDGGLQFSPSTWRAFGGTEYAAYAWQATPEQQIDIAERVAYRGHAGYSPQGPRAWPKCGVHLRPPA